MNPEGWWQRIKSSTNLRPGVLGISIDLKKFFSRKETKPYDEELRQSDTTVFTRLDAMANEALVDDLLNDRIYTSTLKLEDIRLLEDFVVGLQRIENRYLDLKLRGHAEELARDLDAVLSIVDRTFFSVGDGWQKFRPDPIDPEIYDKEWDELKEKLDRAWKAYMRYRSAVKERLMV